MVGMVEAVTQAAAAVETRSPRQEPFVQQPSEQMRAAFDRDVVAAAGQRALPGTGAPTHDTMTRETPTSVPNLQELSSAPPAPTGTLSDRLAAQAGALVDHLRALDPRAEPQELTQDFERTKDYQQTRPRAGTAEVADAQQKGMPAERAMIGDTVAQMERAYMFAIEATLASRGSTEASKIFNTLLKGQ